MRQYKGISPGSLPPPEAPDFQPRLRGMLAAVDHYLQDTAAGFGRIDLGLVPSGSGSPIFDPTTIDLSQYVYMPGRAGGQVVNGVNVADIPLVSRAVSGQTGAVFEAQAFDGTPWFSVAKDGITTFQSSTTGGAVKINWNTGGTCLSVGTSGSSGVLGVQPTSTDVRVAVSKLLALQTNAVRVLEQAAANVAFAVVGASGQSANYFSIETNASSPVFTVRSDGFGFFSAGASNLTAQTASIGATTLLTGSASTAGMYRVSAYLKTTTAGTALDVVKMTLAWNDGSAQTQDVPFESATAIFNNLDLATLNATAHGSVVVNAAASQNISYTTTVTKTGTPQYEIHVRIEALG